MGDTLNEFIDEVCGQDRLRVEESLGDGFVRLRSSEAERRQAAQDITSSEDIAIELLRNARDAHARSIYVATQCSGSQRTLVVLDDGEGIPSSQHKHIFEPRVTTKLDSAHMDKWGLHGRGMALYSIAVNAVSASVQCSAPQRGTSISVTTDTSCLGEKADQSTFPCFERDEKGTYHMRGPKNILRTAAEFALEHRHDCQVYIGSFVEIAAVLYANAVKSLSLSSRTFEEMGSDLPFIKLLGYAFDSEEFSQTCTILGISCSTRSARRIMDGEVHPTPTLLQRIESESFPRVRNNTHTHASRCADRGRIRLTCEDAERLADAFANSVDCLADSYGFMRSDRPSIAVGRDAIRVTVPIEKIGELTDSHCAISIEQVKS